MSSIKYIFFLLFINLVLSQNDTNIPQSNETKEDIPITDEIPENDMEDLNETLNNSYSQTRPKFDKNRPFNLSYDEMDKMIFCTFVVQETIKTKKSDFDILQLKLNLSSPNQIYEKLGTDMFENCNNRVDIKLVNKFVINLTYFDNFKWDDSYKTLSKIDFDKYNNVSDLVLTMEQQILMYKYQSVEEIFRQKRADQREYVDKNNDKIKIGNLELDSIPSSIKFGVLLIVLIVLFGGVFYFLKKMEKKPKDKKKNKKKKTQ